MNSFYKRQFVMMAGVIMISFALLGTAFITLSYQYTIREKRESMSRNADYIASFTANMRANSRLDIRNELYQAYIASLAQISDAVVVLSDTEGQVLLTTDGSTVNMGHSGLYLPQTVLGALESGGGFTGLTDLSGLFPEERYVAGTLITIAARDLITGQTSAQVLGTVCVAAEASSITELWSAFTSIYFFTAVVVLCLAFITSSVTSLQQTKPLKEIADMARKFGHGEFDARVTGYDKRRDEVGELAEAFNAMADSISKGEERRSEFVANISHELKTPMTTIAGCTDGILDGTIAPDRERAALQTISSETRRLSRLVRRMLDLSRLNALTQSTVTAQEAFDFTEVMSQVLISLETKITDRQLDVDVRMPKGKLMVWGDPDAVTQVCYNLLDNAAKFAAPGTAITVQIVKKDGKAHTTIRNLGGTIPPEELPLLFERFHKADYSRSMDREGVGLGLYIVKTILGNLKENITVTSEDGVTQFQFTLTLA